MSESLRRLIELAETWGICIKIWPNGEEVSLYYQCGDFEHPAEAIAWIEETFKDIKLDEDEETHDQ